MLYANCLNFLLSSYTFDLLSLFLFLCSFLLEKMSPESILEEGHLTTARHGFHFPGAPVGLIRMILMILIFPVLLMRIMMI